MLFPDPLHSCSGSTAGKFPPPKCRSPACCHRLVTIILFPNNCLITLYGFLVAIAGAGAGAGAEVDFLSYWDAIMKENIVKDGSKWSLLGDASWIGGTKIMYVSDCYVQLANLLLGEPLSVAIPLVPVKIALILGPKGIGKTMFLNYLIVRIVEKARSASTLDTVSIVYFHQSHGSAEEGVRFTSTDCCINAGKADYYLSDSLDVADGTLGKCQLLEVASENQNNYKKFTERLTEKNGKWITMDVWTLDELKQVKRP